MMAKPLAFCVRFAATLALLTVDAKGFSTAAALPSWLHGSGGDDDSRQAQAPKIARYVIDEGGAFTLDLSQRPPLIKFEDNPEIIVLNAARGPRGDNIYRDDTDEVVLRATKLGGMTVFRPRRPEGAAASLDGPAPSLRLSPLGPVALYQRLVQDSVRCSRLAQHLVGFDAPSVDAASDAVVADAALTTTVAVAAAAAHPGGRLALARLLRVEFVKGSRAGAAFQNGVLTITVNPGQGIAGRPSSKRIAQALLR